mmetsp:Transcript_50923/g.157613  ORF Transcript_50923/g.157613 Transcript_50923/m.157613 type:complete len:245 (-) Transcript_50923:65-799(-)
MPLHRPGGGLRPGGRAVGAEEVLMQQVEEEALAGGAREAPGALGALEVHEHQEPHLRLRQRAPQGLQQPGRGVELPGGVHRPDEDPRLGGRNLPPSEEALRAAGEGVRSPRCHGVVVPEAASPAGRGEDPLAHVGGLAGPREREEVLEAHVEAVDDAVHGAPHPVEGVGVLLEAQRLQRARHAAEAAQGHQHDVVGAAVLLGLAVGQLVQEVGLLHARLSTDGPRDYHRRLLERILIVGLIHPH